MEKEKKEMVTIPKEELAFLMQSFKCELTASQLKIENRQVALNPVKEAKKIVEQVKYTMSEFIPVSSILMHGIDIHDYSLPLFEKVQAKSQKSALDSFLEDLDNGAIEEEKERARKN